MKVRILLLCTALALVFVAAFLMHRNEVFGHYLNAKSGPTLMLEDYSKMERKSDRANALARESPLNRSILWRQHLNFYGAKLNLGGSQKEFLTKVSEFLNEDFFALVDAQNKVSEKEFMKSEQGRPFKELMQQVPGLFSKEQIKTLFSTVGDASTVTDYGCGDSAGKPELNGSRRPCTCVASFCFICPEDFECQDEIWPNPCDDRPGCGCFQQFTCSAECLPR